jgi:O-antigen/teichoic acid export membrane protein
MRARILRGSVLEVGQYGASMLIRFCSGVILTRLLSPEMIGVQIIVFTLSVGLSLMSDFGLRPCMIQSKRGEELSFVNTAFTIQVTRGVVLTVIMLILARPAAWFYKDLSLTPYFLVGALQLVVRNLQSTSVVTMRRRLQLGWVNALDFVAELLTRVVQIIWSYHSPSPWAIVGGSLSGVIFTTIASHFLPVGYRNRFAWDREAVRELSSFGRWIMGSSAITFFGAQGDRILFGRFLGAGRLGVYGQAATLSESASGIIERLITGILYPVLSQAGRERPKELANLYYRLRMRLDLMSMGSLGMMAGLSAWIVHLLYDPRYAEAGKILPVLCLRVALYCVIGPSESCLFAMGHTRYVFLRSLTRTSSLLLGMLIGWRLYGVTGVIWATALAEVPCFLVIWPKCISLRLLRPHRELMAFLIFGASFGLGRLLLPLLPWISVRGRH